MSTSILVNNMRKSAESLNYQCSIEAYSISMDQHVIPKADVILLGPQIRYCLDNLKKKHPDKLIDVIDMKADGLIDGDTVLKQAIALLCKQ